MKYIICQDTIEKKERLEALQQAREFKHVIDAVRNAYARTFVITYNEYTSNLYDLTQSELVIAKIFTNPKQYRPFSVKDFAVLSSLYIYKTADILQERCQNMNETIDSFLLLEDVSNVNLMKLRAVVFALYGELRDYFELDYTKLAHTYIPLILKYQKINFTDANVQKQLDDTILEALDYTYKQMTANKTVVNKYQGRIKTLNQQYNPNYLEERLSDVH